MSFTKTQIAAVWVTEVTLKYITLEIGSLWESEVRCPAHNGSLLVSPAREASAPRDFPASVRFRQELAKNTSKAK